MANNHDIRVWAREQGIEVSDSGPLSTEVKSAYAAYEADQVPAGESAETQAMADEVAPVVKSEGMRERATRHWKERSQTTSRGSSRSTRGKTSPRGKARAPRVSIERMLARGWDMVGGMVGAMLPATGKMMEIQAPVAGMLLEEAAKDTLIDRALQPVARAEQSLGILGVLFGPTLMVAAMELRPDQAGRILPELRKQLMTYVEIAGPKMEVVIERKLKMEEKYGESIDEMLAQIFAYLAPTDEPEATK